MQLTDDTDGADSDGAIFDDADRACSVQLCDNEAEKPASVEVNALKCLLAQEGSGGFYDLCRNAVGNADRFRK